MSPIVLLIGFNRPDFIGRRLSELLSSSLMPTELVISIDGPRSAVDYQNSEEISSIIESFELPFEVRVIRRKSNLGCTNHIIKAVTEVLQESDEVVVIEDDICVGPVFLESMIKGLQYLRFNPDFGIVCAFSPFHRIPFLKYSPKSNYWRQTDYFSAWGWATNKKFWANFQNVVELESIPGYLSESYAWRNFSSRKRQIWIERFERGVWDFNLQMVLFKHSMHCLLPTFRIIDNEGFGDIRSTHTRHMRPRNLFGVGYSTAIPKFGKSPYGNSLFSKFWAMVDSNLWAADGHFTARARKAGIRTYARKFLRV
jgi:hypothetical protein